MAGQVKVDRIGIEKGRHGMEWNGGKELKDGQNRDRKGKAGWNGGKGLKVGQNKNRKGKAGQNGSKRGKRADEIKENDESMMEREYKGEWFPKRE